MEQVYGKPESIEQTSTSNVENSVAFGIQLYERRGVLKVPFKQCAPSSDNTIQGHRRAVGERERSISPKIYCALAWRRSAF